MNSLHSLQKFSWKKRFIDEFVIRSWWVYLFVILNSIGFNFGYKHLEAKQVELVNSLNGLQKHKVLQEKMNEELFLKIKSLQDPRYIELILKQELGLISEDQMKVHFINPN